MFSRIITAVALATLLSYDATTASTVAPTAAPAQTGSWNVTSADGKVVCILLDMAATFNINYTDTAGKTQLASVVLPTDAVATGSCNKTTGEWIQLTFFSDWILTWKFAEDKSQKEVLVQDLILQYNTSNSAFVNIRAQDADKIVTATTNNTDKIGEVALGNSYLCTSHQTINITSEVSIITSQLQMESYREKSTGEFATAQQCAMDTDTSNIVPIVVGAALAALVVIVLIAYLISRNRNKTGYESV